MPAPAPRVTFYVDQGSSAIITATFSLRGVPLIPLTLKWALTSDQGQVINSRKDVPIPSPAPSVSIVLSGADLMTLEPYDDFIRILTVEGTYSSADGTGLTLAGQLVFGLNVLVGSD